MTDIQLLFSIGIAQGVIGTAMFYRYRTYGLDAYSGRYWLLAKELR